MTYAGVNDEARSEPRHPWLRVDALDTVDSTNTHSLRDPSPWRLVTARSQTAGRGRRGRTWVSPSGTCVVLSMTVPSRGPVGPGWMPLLTGLAVTDALTGLVPSARFELKWPNDVLAAPAGPGEQPPAKVCGILCQVATPDLVVVGVGINVSVPRVLLPVETATSLHLLGIDAAPDAGVVTDAVTRDFVRRYRQWADGGEAFDALRKEYRARCVTRGRVVDLHLPDGSTVRGRVVDIDDGGELLLTPDGQDDVRRYAAGDVVHVRPPLGTPNR